MRRILRKIAENKAIAPPLCTSGPREFRGSPPESVPFHGRRATSATSQPWQTPPLSTPSWKCAGCKEGGGGTAFPSFASPC